MKFALHGWAADFGNERRYVVIHDGLFTAYLEDGEIITTDGGEIQWAAPLIVSSPTFAHAAAAEAFKVPA